jgi:hypothetical protein
MQMIGRYQNLHLLGTWPSILVMAPLSSSGDMNTFWIVPPEPPSPTRVAGAMDTFSIVVAALVMGIFVYDILWAVFKRY